MTKSSFNLILKKKISPFNKTIEVDPDKSISIRSILIGSISLNISVKNVLECEKAQFFARNLSENKEN